MMPAAAQENEYMISFSGPQYLVPGETGTLTVNVQNGPEGNVSYNASVSGNGKVTPQSGQTGTDSFTLQVTAPTVTGDFVVTVGVSSVGVQPQVNQTAKYTIKVIPPVIISAVVHNSANVTAQSVPVEFYGDGALLNSTTVSIPANGSKTVTYNWTAPNLAQGQHTVGIKLDPNSQYLHFGDGSREFTRSFYIGDSGWGLANVLLGVVFGLLLLVVFFSYMNRGKKKKPKA